MFFNQSFFFTSSINNLISLIYPELKSNLLSNSVYNTSCFMDVPRKFVRQISEECFSGECQGSARKFFREAVARVANFPRKIAVPRNRQKNEKERKRERRREEKG